MDVWSAYTAISLPISKVNKSDVYVVTFTFVLEPLLPDARKYANVAPSINESNATLLPHLILLLAFYFPL